MDKKKVIIPVILVVAAGGALAWRATHPGEDPNVIRISGNIELTQVDLSFKMPGRMVELNVDEGDTVKPGQVVARTDTNELKQQLNREMAGVDSAQSALTQLHTSIQFQKASIEGDVALKRADLAAAEARLQEMLNGSRPQELESARAAMAEALTQNQQAQLDWQRAQTLYKNDDISTAQRDQFKTKAEATAAALKRAQEQLGMVQEGPRKEQIEQQRAQVARARAAVQLSEANRIDLKRREEEVGMRQAEIQRAKSQTGVLDVQMNDRILVAPVGGVVLSKSAEMGEILAAGATVVTLGDVDKPWVRGYVSESDLGRVKLGMPAVVKTDSFKGKEYKGKVTFISAEAEFTPKQIQTTEERQKLVYRIKIEVENPNHELKLNMPVDAEIVLGR
ncbi:HlyD family efflux transporter periplasmic adaptor subunit [Paludibaculum fermentans]|uniref:HlyD family efflux transporter periplasmic adaptor subunit n=1 Tax=Paludibaculum fermentans TaxID=1473598 RepID=A0A7S7NN25_PALFE|nr:HlyD family efflux transporter periplasmic adaptor subunit [Paludibaculum fermentans]QOY86550.1 HlyD family efflux transporter periplasmic adaptor subunit [Paludibaculum fermentans]